ncbi:MAG: hypothetical protein ACR2P5_08740 [Gammaproteobacteria bacterium]
MKRKLLPPAKMERLAPLVWIPAFAGMTWVKLNLTSPPPIKIGGGQLTLANR